MKDLALWLRMKRTEQGWSQTDLAAKVGVTQKKVSLWENGEPYLARLADLAKAFGITHATALSELADAADPVEQALAQSPDLTPAQQDAFLTFYGSIRRRNSIANVALLRFKEQETPDSVEDAL